MGLLRLVIDLWKRETTHRLVEKILEYISRKYRMKLLRTVQVFAEGLKPLLLEMGYEVTYTGVVNNPRRIAHLVRIYLFYSSNIEIGFCASCVL